ncbi:LuxR C-terminal-related transcriptional regulator [Actinomadura syzygii]
MGYATAAALYRQAADLTPAPHARAGRLSAAAALILRAGRLDEAEELAAQAEKLTDDPAAWARLARVHATVEHERGDPRAASRMMVDHAANASPAERAAMLRTGAVYGWTSGELPAVLRAAELLPDDRTIRGLSLLASGDHATGIPLLAQLVTETRTTTPEGPLHAPNTPPPAECVNDEPPGAGEPVADEKEAGFDGGGRLRGAQLALVIGADEAALELAAAEVAHHRRHGLVGALPNVLRTLAEAQIAMGLHADAEATVAEAVALARDTGLPHRAAGLGAVLARVAAIEGDESRLRELLAGAPRGELAECSLALLDLGLGRFDDALRRLERMASGPRRHGTGSMMAAADQVEAAVRLGQDDRAHEAHERFRAWAEAARQPWALAVALHCEALLSDSGELYERAVRLHEESTRPFEKARTELLYGEWLRRARRRSEARVPLRSAKETFERLRAAPWLERARAELRATGESGPSVPTAPDLLARLTPQELQVVRLAATGTNSREIAAQLFLSPRTVEYHLYKAYPKLGISSRKELAQLTLDTAPPQ